MTSSADYCSVANAFEVAFAASSFEMNDTGLMQQKLAVDAVAAVDTVAVAVANYSYLMRQDLVADCQSDTRQMRDLK